jgi:hypothetical protein
MLATWARGSIHWLVTSFLSNGYQLQFPHGEAMVPQENQTGEPWAISRLWETYAPSLLRPRLLNPG